MPVSIIENASFGNSGIVTANGIKFPATQVASADANVLDDYEEGTWTPSFVVTGGSATYTGQKGTYVKIGKQVTAVFFITVNVSSTLSTNGVMGLPFTSAPDADTQYAGVSFSSYETGAFSGQCNIVGLVIPNNTTFQIRRTASATAAPALNNITITNGTILAGSVTYFAA